MDRIAAPNTKETAKARRAWFRAAGRSADGKDGRRAAAMAVLDTAPAIAFAAGLAFAVSTLPRGLGHAAPGLALMLAAGLVRGLLASAATTSGARLAQKVKAGVRGVIVRAALQDRPGERRPVGESMTLVVEAVEALDGYYARFLPARIASSVAPLILLAAMAAASPIAALIVLGAFAPFIVAMALAGGAAADEARHQFEALNRLSGLFADRVRALPAVLAFQAEDRTAQGLARAAEDLSRRTLKVLRIAFVSSGALEFFAALSVALVAVYCGFNLLGLLPFPVPEKLDLFRAFFVLALAPEVYAPLRKLAAVYHDRQAAEAVVDRFLGVKAPEPTRAASPPIERAPAIRFDQVQVVYPGADRPALNGFDLSLRPGEIVALMGPTGSGKSTALNLLLGLATATAGEITVDGTPIMDEGGLSAHAAWAGQAPVVVPGSLAQNIALARRTSSADAIADAGRRAGLALAPGGLERVIDERGGGLSGGERRRLALARALLRDAPVLLLDEPTANLDVRSEAELLPVIAAAAKGRTTLIATHSQAVASLADRIVRLAA